MRVLFFLIIPAFCFSQEENFIKLKKLPKAEFERAVGDSIIKLDSQTLWNFLKPLRDEYHTNLKPFNRNFINKIEVCESALEMSFLLDFLIEQKTEKTILENVLNRRKSVWDKGLWAEEFWKTIRKNKLNVNEEIYYSVNEKGQKTYKTKLFLEDKIKNNILGSNPILRINHRLSNYPENQILETLEKLNIKDIEIISKTEAPKIFGIRAKDGVMEILTN